MKHRQTKFEDYLADVNSLNLHAELEPIFDEIDNNIHKIDHYIFYGPKGVGKYSQSLKLISKYSEKALKYERKINITQGKKSYQYKISDIHFEVDFELLGCNAKLLWITIYNHIIDIITTRPNRAGIILCKNFHKIHHELLDVFYTYMQPLVHLNLHLKFIIITDEICFLPDEIISLTKIIPVKRPTKTLLRKCFSKEKMLKVSPIEIKNMKNLKLQKPTVIYQNSLIVDYIVDAVLNYENIDMMSMRDHIYNILIFQHDVYRTLYGVLTRLTETGHLSRDCLCDLFIFTYQFLKFYNNNYRPIYHLENYVYYLCKIINGL